MPLSAKMRHLFHHQHNGMPCRLEAGVTKADCLTNWLCLGLNWVCFALRQFVVQRS